MGRKNDIKARNVILKFREKQLREKLYEERKKLIKAGNPAQSTYLNNGLTTNTGSNCRYTARQLVKRRKLYMAWIQHGNILVRKKEDGEITQIKDNSDLMDFKADENDSDHETMQIEEDSEKSHLSDYDYYYDSDL